MDDLEKIQLRSDEVQEILSRPPHALVRMGIGAICSVVLLLIIGSFFFCYPDVIQGEVVLTTNQPPAWVVAKSSGRLTEIYCADKQAVYAGQLLGVVENPANTRDVVRLNEMFRLIEITDSSCVVPAGLRGRNFDVGIIQSSLSAFQTALMHYDNLVSLMPELKESHSIGRQLSERKLYTRNLERQYKMKENEVRLARSLYLRDKQLFDQNVLSVAGLEASEQACINKQQELLQIKTAISLGGVESTTLEGTARKLTVQYLQHKKEAIAALKASCGELKAALKVWGEKYALRAPEDGKLTFALVWTRNQQLSTGDRVFAVISAAKRGGYRGRMLVSTFGAGKIKAGQRVNIKVAGYPFMEYGVLRASVRNISEVALNDCLVVDLFLPDHLQTNMGKELHLQGELQGVAEILTDKRSFFMRIFAPLSQMAAHRLVYD